MADIQRKNILVFPCGSEIGLEIYRSVRYSIHFHLIGASSVSDHGEYVYRDYIGGIPFVDDPQFIPAIQKIVKTRHIEAIYPAMDSVITMLKSHESEIGCRIITCPLETTEICLSKKKTYEKLGGSIRVPRVFQPGEAEDYPVFAKPEIGYGSRGTRILYSEGEVNYHRNKHPEHLILEYLPGNEYTVDCFTDRHGEVLFAGARVRDRIKSGISVRTHFAEEQDEFKPLIDLINQKLNMRGAWFAQFKRDIDGQLCLMEIAARLGGSSALSRAKGINFALLSLFDAFDYETKGVIVGDYDVELDRSFDDCFKCDLSYRTVYVDYDDCMILDEERVNTELAAFLYQCVNNGIKLVLLTKHQGDLEAELMKFRLSSLFDEIIHIKKSDDKKEFITDRDAILIDDSFSERKAISDCMGIPVFSPDMVRCLTKEN